MNLALKYLNILNFYNVKISTLSHPSVRADVLLYLSHLSHFHPPPLLFSTSLLVYTHAQSLRLLPPPSQGGGDNNCLSVFLSQTRLDLGERAVKFAYKMLWTLRISHLNVEKSYDCFQCF